MAEENVSNESSSITSLSDIFSRDPEPEAKEASSADEPLDKKEDKDEGDQKFPASNSSPDEKQDEKSEKPETPAPDEKKESKETPESKPGEEKKEEKPSQDDKAKWDNEENPYFKRYRDTAASWNKEHQEKLQLQNAVTQMQQEMTTLRKIADGTYDPEKDAPKSTVTPETIAGSALEVGKALASHNAAISQYGAEKVEADLNEFHQVFGNNALIQRLVLNAEAPVYEAFRIMDRFRFENKYGSTPADIHKNIKEEVTKELRASIKKEVTEELMKSKNTPRGLSSSRGSNGLQSGQNSKGKGPTPLKDLF